jgi:hypothetical protein
VSLNPESLILRVLKCVTSTAQPSDMLYSPTLHFSVETSVRYVTDARRGSYPARLVTHSVDNYGNTDLGGGARDSMHIN